MSLLTLARILFDKTADQSIAENRARERERRAILSAGMSMIGKFVSVATALISVPLTLHYLGPERYGMWLIMSSLVAMLSFADLGIGNGLLNTVAAAHGQADHEAIRRAISSGLAALGLAAVVVIVTFAAAYPHVAWHRFFNVNSPLARAEAGPAIAVFVACFAMAIPAGIVQKVQMGLQMGFLSSLWQCAGSLLALMCILLAIRLRAGLPWLVAGFLVGPLAASILNSLYFFGRLRRDIAPRPSSATRAAAVEVIQAGGLFFLLQVVVAVAFNAHNILIAQILGTDEVAVYAIPDRLFSLVPMVTSMALSPLWPAYRESIFRGDIAWMRRTLRRSLKMAAGYSAAFCIPLIFAGPRIIHWWVDGDVNPPFGLLLGLALWKIIECVGIALAMFLNGAHVVRTQVVVASATAIGSIVMEFIFLYRFGIAGVPWASVIAFTAFALVPYLFLLPRILRRIGVAS